IPPARRHAEVDRQHDDAVIRQGLAIDTLLKRSPAVQAPPWTSSTAGKGPGPSGRYKVASNGWPSGFWYSMSWVRNAMALVSLGRSLPQPDANGNQPRAA